MLSIRFDIISYHDSKVVFKYYCCTNLDLLRNINMAVSFTARRSSSDVVMSTERRVS